MRRPLCSIGDNHSLCHCFSEGAVHLDGITWNSSFFWEVISYHKYTEPFYQISHTFELQMFHVERLVYAHVHSIFAHRCCVTAQILQANKKTEYNRTAELPLCYFFPEPQLLLDIYHRKSSARHVTNTSTKTTCSTLQGNTGKVIAYGKAATAHNFKFYHLFK